MSSPPKPPRDPPRQPPAEPFLLRRTPPRPTLLGLVRPPPLPATPPAAEPEAAPVAAEAEPAAEGEGEPPTPRTGAPGEAAAAAPAAPDGGALARQVDGLRRELVYFRLEWWPVHGPAAPREGARPRRPVGFTRRPGAALLALAALALAALVALGSAAAALRWPAYGRFVGAATLGAARAPER